MKVFKKAFNTFSDMDKVLFFTTLILIIFGTLNIVTASSREAVVNAEANLFYYFFKHIIILIISFISFLIVLNIDTKEYKNLMPIIYVIVFAMNLFLILKGVTTRGANNWIDLKVIKIQPSELAKPTLILTMSLLFEKYYRKLRDVREKHDLIIWQIIGFALIFPILVFLQKDLGTAIILFGIFLVLFLFSPIKFDIIKVKTMFKNISFPCHILLSNIIPLNLVVNPLNKNIIESNNKNICDFSLLKNFLANI